MDSPVVQSRRSDTSRRFQNEKKERSSSLKKIAMDWLNHLKTAYRPRFFNAESEQNATDIQGESVVECTHDCFERSKVSEEIKENDFEVLGSPALLVESGEEGEEEGEKSCAEKSSATLKPEEECEFIIEEYLSSASWFSISEKKQKPPKRTTSASFEGNQEAKQHNKRKINKRELKKTVYKNSSEIHNTSYPKSKKQAKGRIPLLESDEKLSVQIKPLEITKQSLSRNKLTTLTKVQYEKQEECTVLALAQESCHNTQVKKQLPSKKKSGTQKKRKRSPAGPMGKENRQLVSKQSLEDVHGEEHLDKKKNLHPFKLKNQLKRATPQKIRDTSLPKPQNNVLYQEDSCEQHVAKKHSNISVTPQNNERSLSHDPLLLPLHSNEMFRRELNQLNTDDSDSVVLPTSIPIVRRSKRTRIKPLEYWRGERIDYKIGTSGDFVSGIISPEQKESRKCKAKVGMKSVSETENLHNNSIFTESFFQPAVVFNKASNQQILLECVHNGSSPAFCFSNEILSIYKYFSTPSFASGKIILNPFKEKGYQYSHTDTLIFHIICGKLLLMLYDQSYRLTAGNYFFIPPGNVYNIRNLLNEECVILFTQLKGKEHLDN